MLSYYRIVCQSLRSRSEDCVQMFTFFINSYIPLFPQDHVYQGPIKIIILIKARLGVKATTCKAKAKAKAKYLTFKAKAKDLILEDNKVGYQNEYKSATMSKFNC